MNKPTIDPCPRCGVERVVKYRGTLCRDCTGTLTAAELLVWRAA